MASPPLAGATTIQSYVPDQLYAGEAPITTTYEVVAAGNNVKQYTIMGRLGDGRIAPWAPGATDAEGRTYAQGTLTFAANPAPADTLTINGVVATFRAAGLAAGANDIEIGATPIITAANTATYVNEQTEALLVHAGTTTTNVVALQANDVGTAGNAITLAKSGTNPAVSGATMAGGSATGADVPNQAIPFCIAMQDIDATDVDVSGPVALGGVFNHEILIWPASISTEAARKAAFDRTPLSVKTLY